MGIEPVKGVEIDFNIPPMVVAVKRCFGRDSELDQGAAACYNPPRGDE